LPDIQGAEYLVEMFNEVGAGVSWSDLLAWRDATGTVLTPGEALAVKDISAEYMAQLHRSLEPGCPSPNIEIVSNRANVEHKLKALFSMMRNRKDG